MCTPILYLTIKKCNKKLKVQMISPYAHALTAVFAISFLIGAKESILSCVTSFLILFHSFYFYARILLFTKARKRKKEYITSAARHRPPFHDSPRCTQLINIIKIFSASLSLFADLLFGIRQRYSKN